MKTLRTYAALLALGLPFVAACADPQGALDDFETRYAADNPATASACTTTCTPPSEAMASGDFLFVLSAKLSPKTPVVFLTHVTAVPSTMEGSPYDLDLNITALETVPKGSTATPMTPTGSAVDVGPFPVSTTGCFTEPFPVQTVPGNADPILPGQAIVSQITITGTFCDSTPNFMCGDVTGAATKPIATPLAGSTFTFERITDMSKYPAIEIDCAGTVVP
jgi:hypothetical protein